MERIDRMGYACSCWFYQSKLRKPCLGDDGIRFDCQFCYLENGAGIQLCFRKWYYSCLRVSLNRNRNHVLGFDHKQDDEQISLVVVGKMDLSMYIKRIEISTQNSQLYVLQFNPGYSIHTPS